MALIFLAVAWKFQPEESEGIGRIILLVLGILVVLSILAGGFYLYSKHGRKISVPSFNGTGKFLGKMVGREKLGTALLVCLFLLTLSYVVGGREEWKDSLGWWWNSKIFLPSLLAVIAVILFVDTKWRKKINNALIFTISAMILLSLLAVTPSITKWFKSTNEDGNKMARNTIAPNSPQNVEVKPVEMQKTRKETILAEYGAFKEVSLPPTEKLINISWEFPSRYNGRCLAIVVHKARPDGEEFPCENPTHGFVMVKRVGFSSNDPLEGIPVEIKTTYLGTE